MIRYIISVFPEIGRIKSPPKKKIDHFKDTLKTSFENFDTNLKAALYHISKNEVKEGVKEVEKVRRLTQATSMKAQFLIGDLRIEYSGAIQKYNSMSTRMWIFIESMSLSEADTSSTKESPLSQDQFSEDTSTSCTQNPFPANNPEQKSIAENATKEN